MKFLNGMLGLSCFVFSLCIQADVVHLKNGDKISGKVNEMSAKTLLIETKYAGKIRLKWEDISTLATVEEVTLRADDNTILKGKITGLKNAQIIIDGASLSALNFANISSVNPEPVNEYIGAGKFNFGGFRSDGNTDKFFIHTDAEYVIKNQMNRFSLGAIYKVGFDSGEESENNIRAFTKYDRFIHQNWYGYANADFTKDRFQNLEYRITGGAGLGYQFWDDAEKYLSFESGIGYTYEAFNIDKNRNYVTARWAIKTHYWLLADELQFFHDHEGLISVENPDDTLVRTHTGFKVPVYKGFNFLLQFDFDYKNKPAENTKKADFRYIMGVGYTL